MRFSLLSTHSLSDQLINVRKLGRTWQDWGMRNARKTAFHAAAQFYTRQLGITCNGSLQPILVQSARPGLEQRIHSEEDVGDLLVGGEDSQSAEATGGAATVGGTTKAGALGFVPPPEEQNRIRQRKMKSRKGANRGMAEG